MKITFVVPTLNLSGGLRVISVYAKLLSQRGHQVTVVSPSDKTNKIQRFKNKIFKKEIFKINFDDTYFQDANYSVKVLEQNRSVTESDVPDADIIIATFWYTAEWIKNFPEAKGKKVYFIQHYEMHPWLPLDRVTGTFQFPFKKIVVSKWIADCLLNNHGVNDISIVGNGVDHELFHAPPRRKQKKLTVGLMYADEKSFKGCDTSLASIEIAKKTFPDLKVIAFAAHPPRLSLPLPLNTEFHLKPDQDKLRDIYSSCDVWLFGSRLEGFGLPLLEAMACRTPIIATKAGVAPELLADATSGFLIDIDDVNSMSAAILSIGAMTNSDWEVMSNNAYLKSKVYDWDTKVDEFSSVLIELLKND
ncbi:glycosyltransferase family 4 protein [Methylophaga sp.]|uniref:glycosyltransferase family 4 protein n=1 Tax=Methylophaga sp. TaxID=2024840 RepID=UPI00271FD97F|nr:glycosyltransferase family 4 protein [Methylophaga sp.]MDO8825453.1 glycosyltransferase family 4 protein [Methylophaga sp.]